MAFTCIISFKVSFKVHDNLGYRSFEKLDNLPLIKDLVIRIVDMSGSRAHPFNHYTPYFSSQVYLQSKR